MKNKINKTNIKTNIEEKINSEEFKWFCNKFYDTFKNSKIIDIEKIWDFDDLGFDMRHLKWIVKITSISNDIKRISEIYTKDDKVFQIFNSFPESKLEFKKREAFITHINKDVLTINKSELPKWFLESEGWDEIKDLFEDINFSKYNLQLRISSEDIYKDYNDFLEKVANTNFWNFDNMKLCLECEDWSCIWECWCWCENCWSDEIEIIREGNSSWHTHNSLLCNWCWNKHTV